MKNLAQRLLKNIFAEKLSIVEKSFALENKVIIITGATRGIGKATAEVLIASGAKIVAVARNKKNLDEVYKKYSEENVLTISADVTKEEDVKRIVKTTINKYKKIDVIINNAGIFLDKPFEKITISEFTSMLETNMKAAFLLSREVIPHMKYQKEGFIINVGSKISRNTNVAPKKVLYAMTKYAIEGMSFALNRELKQYGIRVSCLLPGTVNTFFSRKSHIFLSPYDVGKLIKMMIEFEKVDFENIVFKSIKQNL